MQSSLPDLSARLTRIYESFAAGDPRPMSEFLADDVVYHLPGKHLGGGALHGRVEVLERVAKAALDCDAPPTIRLIAVVASGALAVSLERFTARRAGRTLDQEACVVWRIVGERCVEIWSHFADQPACDRFWDRG
ncbi:MAG: nuclear transport factor 2 family protein [Candidatus Binatia bacterium]